MRLYRERATNTKPMRLAGTYEQFKDEWLKVWTDKRSDSTALLSLGRPFLKNWESQLTQRVAPDLHYQTLNQRLESEGHDPEVVIPRWIEDVKNTSSLKEELELLYLKIARNNRWFPKYASPQNTAYVFAHIFKCYLQKEIERTPDPLVDTFYTVHIHEYVTVEDPHPDYLLIRALNLDEWDSYLLIMLRQGYDRASMCELTHLPEHIVRLERKTIWNRLSTA